MTPHFNNAGRFYPWLVVVVVVSAVAMIAWQILQLIGSAGSFRSFFWSKENYLAISLSFVATATLVWRIVFALLYKPIPSVHDAQLPRITVVIPAYNEGEQVLSTVRSIMASHYPMHKMQVICVDDGSLDDTWQWMLKAQDEFPQRVKLIRQPGNRGKRQALLAGFAQATGQIFVTIDSDSEVMPDTLRNLVSPYVVDERIGASAGNVRVLNLEEGAIPKMMDVSFTNAFDFVRSGQSVYGGVFCTPGALSSYRAKVVKPHLTAWANQTFMGKPATIGEDRALTNIVLGTGHRVIYQRNAVVLTKMPTQFTGLRKMLLRWARSNVREHLVMLSFVIQPHFRPNDSGSNWLRLFSLTQMFRMATAEAFKFVVLIQLIAEPVSTLTLLATGCLMAAVLPGIVYQIRYGGFFGWKWAIAFSFYWLCTLCWIPLWGTFTATQSGWLTRGLSTVPQPAADASAPSSTPVHSSKMFS
jgi:hyaluronan synthase